MEKYSETKYKNAIIEKELNLAKLVYEIRHKKIEFKKPKIIKSKEIEFYGSFFYALVFITFLFLILAVILGCYKKI